MTRAEYAAIHRAACSPTYGRDNAWGPSGSPARFDVDVTREHIAAGKIGSMARCPIALAMRDARRLGAPRSEPPPLRDADVRVGGVISWVSKQRLLAVTTPDRVARWLADFDAGAAVSPMSFVLTCYSVADHDDGWAPKRGAST